jgi:hypothetical protein
MRNSNLENARLFTVVATPETVEFVRVSARFQYVATVCRMPVIAGIVRGVVSIDEGES